MTKIRAKHSFDLHSSPLSLRERVGVRALPRDSARQNLPGPTRRVHLFPLEHALRYRSLIPVLIVCLFCLSIPAGSDAAERGFKTYVDPAKRFSFDYPATMTVKPEGLNEVKIFHPKATLRITVFIEKRSSKTPPRAAPLLEMLKKRLKDEMKDARVLQEGKLSDPNAQQGYVICYFKDKRGVGLVQLVHYYVAPERILQMIISDRPQGFKNLATVIRTIHKSLKILSPGLK